MEERNKEVRWHLLRCCSSELFAMRHFSKFSAPQSLSEERSVDAENPQQVFDFYMKVWKIFYAAWLQD